MEGKIERETEFLAVDTKIPEQQKQGPGLYWDIAASKILPGG